MKKISLITWCLGLVMVASAFAVSTASGDDVRGTYWNAEKTAQIRIYRAKNEKYYGKIEMLVEPNGPDGIPKKDPENPNEDLRSRDRLGMIIMKSFEWNEDDKE